MGIESIEHLTDPESKPNRMDITEDLIRLIREGKARIVSKTPIDPINGRPMVKIELEVEDG